MRPQDDVFAVDSDSDDEYKEARPLVSAQSAPPRRFKSPRRSFAIAIGVFLLLSFGISFSLTKKFASAYIYHKSDVTDISHYWGQYSPFFSLRRQSEINPAVPPKCNITFVQVLSRHGARYPTYHKSIEYVSLIDRIQQTAKEYRNDIYALLRDYRYTLGDDDLTTFGEVEMFDSGTTFYNRYRELARHNVPFVRASGSDRVIASANLFSHGYNEAKIYDPYSDKSQYNTSVDLIIPEGREWNNTLDTGTCETFSDGSPVKEVQREFLNIFAISILQSMMEHMPGVNLALIDIPLLMDLCPFETVNNPNGTLSPLCNLFSISDWYGYDYYKTLEKYYAFGAGNPLGSTRGVGYVNELISRMTKSLPVIDHTSVNHTLDSDPDTFPLDTALYADFTHDNAMVSIFDAFGLYNSTPPLSAKHVQSAAGTKGFSASWVVPFASRAYFEVMRCASEDDQEEEGEELVRVLVNDRVVPLHGCDVDDLGRCKLKDWIDGLDFARNGGRWEDYCTGPTD